MLQPWQVAVDEPRAALPGAGRGYQGHLGRLAVGR